MTFLYPSFLWAALLIGIPIIIHLFQFRRFKTVYFTNVKDLKELKEETGRRNRLKHLLVLFARCLFLLFLVAAFAQPILKAKKSKEVTGTYAIGIFVDNSFSMEVMDDGSSLLSQAKSKAADIVKAFSEQDKFQILTQEMSGSEQQLLSKEKALEKIEGIESSAFSRSYENINSRIRDALASAESDKQKAYWISDFQKQKGSLSFDSAQSLSLLPLKGQEQNNITIDSIWLEVPFLALGQNAQLMVRINNYSETEVLENVLNLKVNGKVKSISSLNLDPQSSKIDTLNFKISETGWHRCEVNLTDFPITFDDQYFFAFKVNEVTKVLCVNQQGTDNDFIHVFPAQQGFLLNQVSVSSVDYSSFPDYDLIILNDLVAPSSGLTTEIQKYLNNGGNLFCSPAKTANLQNWNSLCQQLGISQWSEIEEKPHSVAELRWRERIFREVFQSAPRDLALPQTKANFPLNSGSRVGRDLMTFKNGSPFLSQTDLGGAIVFQLAAPLNLQWNSFKRNDFFPLIFHNMALMQGGQQQLSFTLGTTRKLDISTKDLADQQILKLRQKDFEIVPAQRAMGRKTSISLGDGLARPGIFEVFSDNQEALHFVGINHPRNESKMEFWDKDELKEIFGATAEILAPNKADLSASIKEGARGKALWKLCIIFALLFLAAEVLLLRFWRA